MPLGTRFIMSLKDHLDDDAVNVFLNTDEFAEDITYTPSGGPAKSIKAIIDREQLEPSEESRGRVTARSANIEIANNSTYGVDTVNKGADTVSFPVNVGEGAVSWLVVKIIDQDPGMWLLEVRR